MMASHLIADILGFLCSFSLSFFFPMVNWNSKWIIMSARDMWVAKLKLQFLKFANLLYTSTTRVKFHEISVSHCVANDNHRYLRNVPQRYFMCNSPGSERNIYYASPLPHPPKKKKNKERIFILPTCINGNRKPKNLY